MFRMMFSRESKCSRASALVRAVCEEEVCEQWRSLRETNSSSSFLGRQNHHHRSFNAFPCGFHGLNVLFVWVHVGPQCIEIGLHKPAPTCHAWRVSL